MMVPAGRSGGGDWAAELNDAPPRGEEVILAVAGAFPTVVICAERVLGLAVLSIMPVT